MVSFWPWKGDDTASFERVLASLSDRIKKANVKQDRLRNSSRRYKVIWTLYSSLAYLVTTLVLVLVTGWQSWGPVEYTSVAGGPVIIYLVRTSLAAFYDYRISSNQTHLDNLNQQRNEAIDKFKNATKFNTTQQLLEKYGAAPKQPSTPQGAPASDKRKSGANDGSRNNTPQRTNLPPPPTANIRRPQPPNSSPQSSPTQQGSPPYYGNSAQQRTPTRSLASSVNDASTSSPSASFAPNAFTSAASAPPQYSNHSQRQWYDRIFDVLLGEDETRASNRIALVCQQCKLVNGQAPPGVKRQEDIGRWRCAECRGWNGVVNEVDVVLDHAKKEGSVKEKSPEDSMGSADDGSPAAEQVDGEPGPAVEADDTEGLEEREDSLEPPARSTRSRKKKSEEDD